MVAVPYIEMFSLPNLPHCLVQDWSTWAPKGLHVLFMSVSRWLDTCQPGRPRPLCLTVWRWWLWLRRGTTASPGRAAPLSSLTHYPVTVTHLETINELISIYDVMTTLMRSSTVQLWEGPEVLIQKQVIWEHNYHLEIISQSSFSHCKNILSMF